MIYEVLRDEFFNSLLIGRFNVYTRVLALRMMDKCRQAAKKEVYKVPKIADNVEELERLYPAFQRNSVEWNRWPEVIKLIIRTLEEEKRINDLSAPSIMDVTEEALSLNLIPSRAFIDLGYSQSLLTEKMVEAWKRCLKTGNGLKALDPIAIVDHLEACYPNFRKDQIDLYQLAAHMAGVIRGSVYATNLN